MGQWWVHDLWQAGRHVELVSWIFWVIASITLHELGHGWAALWQGDDTPRRLGRMTANPLVHLGPWSLIVFAMMGLAWGLMPVNPSRFRSGPRGRVLVAAAGPAMNVALAIVALTAVAIWLAVGPTGSPLYRNLAVFFWTGGWLNLLLALFNLLPIPPLDGSTIVGGLSFRAYRMLQHPQAQIIGLALVLAVFIFAGLDRYVILGCKLLALAYAEAVGAVLGGPALADVLL